MPPVLDLTRATSFELGTNLKGDVAGAAWTFALPTLELERILCVGWPGAATLATLARLGRQVEVECGPLGRRRLRRLGLANVGAAERGGEPVDLLVVGRRRLGRASLARLAPNGVVFDESPRQGRAGERLRLHPARGEARLIVPERNAAAARRRLRVHTDAAVRRRALNLVKRIASAGSRPAALRGAEPGPPRYVRALAAEAGLDLARHGWSLAAPGDYSSRKVTLSLFAPGGHAPAAVVKLTRSPGYNGRLVNEHRALRLLEELGIGADGSVPRALFFGTHAGLAVLGESAVAGEPFRRRTSARPDCPLARAACEWLVELGARTASPGVPAEAAGVLEGLLSRFTEIYELAPAQRDFLAVQIQAVGASDALPLVFQHGDPGTWNLLAGDAGRVAFLDWEAAEPHGLPLWDLFYFMRSFGVTVARARGTRDALDAFEISYLADSELSRALRAAVGASCRRTGIALELVQPLFYTCWMHRALKEAGRLPFSRLERGHYVNVLRLCIERRDAPGLRGLFSVGAEPEARR